MLPLFLRARPPPGLRPFRCFMTSLSVSSPIQSRCQHPSRILPPSLTRLLCSQATGSAGQPGRQEAAVLPSTVSGKPGDGTAPGLLPVNRLQHPGCFATLTSAGLDRSTSSCASAKRHALRRRHCPACIALGSAPFPWEDRPSTRR